MDSNKNMEQSHIIKIKLNDNDTVYNSKYEKLDKKKSEELIKIMLKYYNDIFFKCVLYLNDGKNRFLLSKSLHDGMDYIKKEMEKESDKEKILILSKYERFIIPDFIKQNFLDCCIKKSFLIIKQYYESIRTAVKENVRKWKDNRKIEKEADLKKLEEESTLLSEEIVNLQKDKKQNFQKIKDLEEKINIVKEEIKLVKEKLIHVDELVYYAFSILSKDINLFFKCLKHETPSIEETFDKNEDKNFYCLDIERAFMARRIRKFAKKFIKHPLIKRSYQSAYFEESLYEINYSENNEYINISLMPFKGIKINFITKSFFYRDLKITKNIIFVLDNDEYYIHIPQSTLMTL